MKPVCSKYFLFLPVLIAIASSESWAAEFSLFGDVQYQSRPEENGFILGPLDLIVDQALSDTTSVVSDLLFEDHDGAFEYHLDRLFLNKALGKHYSFTAGRFQKPLGFWSHNFHHGSIAQDTVSRPFFLESDEYEDGIFPVHLVGALLGYESAKSTFQLAVANNTGMNTQGIAGPEDTTSIHTINLNDPGSGKALVTRLTFRPTSGPLELGLISMLNHIVETGEDSSATIVNRGDTLFDQQVYGFDASYFSKRFYSFGEIYKLIIKDNQSIDAAGYTPNSGSYSATAYYIQVGYRITDTVTVAARHESLDFDDGAYFAIQGIAPETRNLIALKYRIEESNAFRVEIRQQHRQDHDSETVYAVQWFFYLL